MMAVPRKMPTVTASRIGTVLDGKGGEGTEVSKRSWLDKLLSNVEHATQLYHRLIIVVESAEGDQIELSEAMSTHVHLSRVNVSMELGERLLDTPVWQRPLRTARLLEEIVGGSEGDVVWLYHLELLFESSLAQDPLRLLQTLSRRRTVVVVWSGSLEGDSLIYAVPGHLEYRRYPTTDLLLVPAKDHGGS